MSEYIKYFLNGYSKSLDIFPNYNINNMENDWISISNDIEKSMHNYTKIKALDKSCQTQKETLNLQK